MADQYARYRHLCGTAGEWAASDIIIGEGEIAVELPSTAGGKPRAKAGDGTRRYSQLQYIDGMDQAALNALLANYILKADGVTLAKLNADLTAERTRAEGAYVNIGGDRMTGQLELPGGGTGNQAATVSQLTTAIATTGTTTGGTGKNGQLIRTDVRGMIDLSLVSIPGGLRILGARDPSTAAPTSPGIGDAYIVDRDTTAHASYGPGVTGTLNSGDMLIYVGGVGGWDSLAAHADLNAYVKRVGDTMTGPLVLSGAPTADLHAATKKYTDDTFVNVAGDTMTGPLVLSGVPALAPQAASRGYVDSIRHPNQLRVALRSMHLMHKSIATHHQQMLKSAASATGTVSTVAGFPGGGAHVGGVLMADGRVFCVPFVATSASIYDPATGTVSAVAGFPGGGAYYGGVLMADGRVFCVPNNATSASIYEDGCSHPTLNFPFAMLLGNTINKL